MNMQYSAMIYLILFALFILIWIVRNNGMLEEKKKKEFITIFAIIMIAAGSEWLGFVIDGMGGGMRWIHVLAKSVDHSLAPVISIVFVNIISNKEKAKPLIFLVVIHGILELASGYWGFIYRIDEKGNYTHGSFYWIYIMVYLVCTIYLLVEIARFSQKYQSANRKIIYMAFLFLLTGVSFRLLNSEVRVDYMCLGLDTIIMYIYYTEIVEKTDSITNLLNRRSYESYLTRIRKPSAILYLDIDNFKMVNDCYGHHAGDVCLEMIGRSIQKIYSPYGSCYRIGGDEFCVILDRKLDCVEVLNEKFRKELEQKKKENPQIPYVSVGTVFFDPEKTDVESALKEADTQMYCMKQKNKAARKSAGEELM